MQFGAPQLVPRIQVSEAEQKARVVHQNEFVPPRESRKSAEKGVKLQILVGIDGRVWAILKVIEGEESLRSAAVAAASKWQYRPNFIGGIPTEVVTEIFVPMKR